MTSLTRGPLPPRVYWRRRLLLLGLACVLVLAIARVLGTGSDASSEADRASQVAATVTSSSPTDDSSAAAGSGGRGSRNKGRNEPTLTPTPTATAVPTPTPTPTPSPTPLAEPTGPCADEDIAVTPEVPGAVAGSDVAIVLSLRTIASPACTWRVSPSHVTLKITSGEADIWSSRQCPASVPTQDVVVRSTETTQVGVVWNARRADDTCSARSEYALPGFYHVAAAAFAGEPSDVQFELTAPLPVVVTQTADPTQAPTPPAPTTPAQTTPAPTEPSPSGAVEPDQT